MPPPGEVHVHVLRLVGAPDLELLSAEERERAARLRDEDDQRRWVLARAGLRRVLGDVLRAPPGSLAFGTWCRHCGHASHGKPYLAGAHASSPLRFSLSHAGELALVALAVDREVGVDVERVDEDVDVEAVARVAFGERERAALAATRVGRVPLFFDLWTRREAALKATGHGIVVDREPVGASALVVEPLRVAPGYAAAVAFEGPPARVRLNPCASSG